MAKRLFIKFKQMTALKKYFYITLFFSWVMQSNMPLGFSAKIFSMPFEFPLKFLEFFTKILKISFKNIQIQ
jgi:hypothetical protein